MAKHHAGLGSGKTSVKKTKQIFLEYKNVSSGFPVGLVYKSQQPRTTNSTIHATFFN